MSPRLPSRPTTRAFVALQLALIALGVVSCLSDRSTSSTTSTANCSAPSSTAGATIIFVRAFAYLPPQVHVKAGENVAWVNCEPDGVPHTATADDRAWDSGLLPTPEAFVRAFPAAGSFPYHCTLHPSMKATVIVD